MALTLSARRTLSSVDPAAWDALDHGGSPFLEHGFLRALERSRSIGARSGWDPHYILAEWAGEPDATRGAAAATAVHEPLLVGPLLVGAVACFVKHHSYGEYIFDFPWARAAERSGIEYYPKLVVAAPVTPATGPRILLRPPSAGAPAPEVVARALVECVRALADEEECSSIHWLFTTAQEHALLEQLEFSPRASFQFHFHNRFQERGYADFDEFLAQLTSRKRKQIKKERARARAAVDGIEMIGGAELQPDDLEAIDRFYRNTTDNHGGHDYLRPGFFEALVELAPHRVCWARARRGGETVAGALYLETERALFGRYWGCNADIELLHFELACYAGIERCIRQGLPLFEAGAQGEHKLLRGFEPSPTYSSHWIRHDGLRAAVERFLVEERHAVERYLVELAELGPYRAPDGPTEVSSE